MYFDKITVLLVIAVCVAIDAGALKRKSTKPKVKKPSLQNIAPPPCGCQNPTTDIFSYGYGPAIDPILGALGSFEIGIPGCQGAIIEPAAVALGPQVGYSGFRSAVIEPALGTIAGCLNQVIDIPNYRYADPLELKSLAPLFPSVEISSYGFPAAQLALPSVEYITAIELPCGCPGPQCGCRTPVEAPSCGCQSRQVQSIPAYSYGAMTSVIEVPSYTPTRLACGHQGPCSCSSIQAAGIPVSPCGCQGPCSCPEYQILPCGCQGSCTCPEYQIITCGCQGSCACPEYQILSCGCRGSCACPEYQNLSCGCQGSCSCSELPSPCGCRGPCGCSGAPASCGCQGPCSCSAIQTSVGLLPAAGYSGAPASCGCQGSCSCSANQALVGLLPAAEVPLYGCGCNLSGCGCSKYLRQITLQPPFL